MRLLEPQTTKIIIGLILHTTFSVQKEFTDYSCTLTKIVVKIFNFVMIALCCFVEDDKANEIETLLEK